ncbi:ribbon-helix-helix protein, CopG family [Bradyrhizobium pachyrhizi]|uniref:Ribbon-helix-helix protein, CopG family n=1 Tax=Bradyrhizobium pachyrhizi TaxID=280333 RepID=A0A844SR25_9BRAD|nr:ribbon-helix-helix protein, CopG family [Bradyrhizobium pachyrhizi]MVT69438.1 ribbon-helix-helix protein, CopG family [Bradyrhizobium pachyrhizi]
MKKAILKSSRGGKRPGAGRPATGNDPVRTLRLSDEFIEKVDHWAAEQEDAPGRSEAIRRLVEMGLKAKR